METAGDTCVIDSGLVYEISKTCIAKSSEFMALSVIPHKPQRDESMCWVMLLFS